jgi:hypothetical protein
LKKLFVRNISIDRALQVSFANRSMPRAEALRQRLRRETAFPFVFPKGHSMLAKLLRNSTQVC